MLKQRICISEGPNDIPHDSSSKTIKVKDLKRIWTKAVSGCRVKKAWMGIEKAETQFFNSKGQMMQSARSS